MTAMTATIVGSSPAIDGHPEHDRDRGVEEGARRRRDQDEAGRDDPRRAQDVVLRHADAVAHEGEGQRGEPRGRVEQEVEGEPGREAGDGAALGVGLEPGGDGEEEHDVADPDADRQRRHERHLDQQGDQDHDRHASCDHDQLQSSSQSSTATYFRPSGWRSAPARGSSRCGRRSAPTDSTVPTGMPPGYGPVVAARDREVAPSDLARELDPLVDHEGALGACGGGAHVAGLDQLHPDARGSRGR